MDENVAQILEDELRAVQLREEHPDDQPCRLTDEPAPLPPAPSFHAVLLEFVKQLGTTGTDLHRLTAPAIMLNGVSLLEYSAHWCDHPQLFSAITGYEHPVDRMVAIVKWYVSNLYGSYASRTQGGGFERKPYNPILGEQFRCHWNDQVTLLAEQGK